MEEGLHGGVTCGAVSGMGGDRQRCQTVGERGRLKVFVAVVGCGQRSRTGRGIRGVVSDI